MSFCVFISLTEICSLPTGPGNPSGFGFELTFRLKREEGDVSPPTWPACMMQSLSKYVFSSENILCPGDHVSWNCSLDNSDSRIQHILLTEDPQLGNIGTRLGTVTFVQIIGVCQEELRAAQQWNGPGLIDLIKSVPAAGGVWLITDMRRGESIFDLDPGLREAVEDGIAAEGSNLSGASAKISWSEDPARQSHEGAIGGEVDESKSEKEVVEKEVHVTIEDSKEENRTALSPTLSQSLSRMSIQDNVESGSRMSTRGVTEDVACSDPTELIQTKFPQSVNLTINHEAGNILPLALR